MDGFFLQVSSSTTLFSTPAFSGPSLDYVGGTDPNDSNIGRLRDKLNEADTERRKAAEEADRRERAAEIAREERQRKIDYMNSMPDDQPAGTGKYMRYLYPRLMDMS